MSDLDGYRQMRVGLKCYAAALGSVGCDPVDGFADCVRLAIEARSDGNMVFFVGNGGSAAIASHMAADWQKAGNIPCMSFNDAASLTALANDCGYAQVFEQPLMMHGMPGNILFAISSSGKSRSILNAAAMAKHQQMKVVTLSGFSAANPLRQMGDVNFHVPSSDYGEVETAHLAILHAILKDAVHG